MWDAKKVVLAGFDSMVACFGPPKIPKCLENGPTWDQKRSPKDGSTAHLFKIDPVPFVMYKQVNQAQLFLTIFSPIKRPINP